MFCIPARPGSVGAAGCSPDRYLQYVCTVCARYGIDDYTQPSRLELTPGPGRILETAGCLLELLPPPARLRSVRCSVCGLSLSGRARIQYIHTLGDGVSTTTVCLRVGTNGQASSIKRDGSVAHVAINGSLGTWNYKGGLWSLQANAHVFLSLRR